MLLLLQDGELNLANYNYQNYNKNACVVFLVIYYLLFAFLAVLVPSTLSSLEAGVVDTLDPNDSISYNTVGPLASWNGNGDTADATFTLKVDFDSKVAGNGEVLWETGGRITGSSLLYVATDTLRFASVQSGVATQVDYQLTPDQIAAREIFVSWVFDLGNDEMRLVTSHANGLDFHEVVASVAYSGTDWSGSNGGGLGVKSGGLGGYLLALPTQAFASGNINVTEGLRFYAGDAYAPSPVPEPAGTLALTGAIALVCFQRRRSNV
ncbi:MAG: hypothetical protein ACI9R3_002667 [Verrucomicrobiales bacterium]